MGCWTLIDQNSSNSSLLLIIRKCESIDCRNDEETDQPHEIFQPDRLPDRSLPSDLWSLEFHSIIEILTERVTWRAPRDLNWKREDCNLLSCEGWKRRFIVKRKWMKTRNPERILNEDQYQIGEVRNKEHQQSFMLEMCESLWESEKKKGRNATRERKSYNRIKEIALSKAVMPGSFSISRIMRMEYLRGL